MSFKAGFLSRRSYLSGLIKRVNKLHHLNYYYKSQETRQCQNLGILVIGLSNFGTSRINQSRHNIYIYFKLDEIPLATGT